MAQSEVGRQAARVSTLGVAPATSSSALVVFPIALTHHQVVVGKVPDDMGHVTNPRVVPDAGSAELEDLHAGCTSLSL